MSLHVSVAAVVPGSVPSGGTIVITVNCHVDKAAARGGARYTLPEGPVFFELDGTQFKRVFLPEFTLTMVSAPVVAALVVVSSTPIGAVPISIEIADLDENPPESLGRAATINVL